MGESWDWKPDGGIPILSHAKEYIGSSRILPPSLMRGAFFQGDASDDRLYAFGGTAYYGNTSFPGWVDMPDAPPLWVFNTHNNTWIEQNTSIPLQRPNNGAAADALEAGLSFYLNGQSDNTTQSKNTPNRNGTSIMDGLLVFDHRNMSSVRNVSTEFEGGRFPRIGGTMNYISRFGHEGILVSLGGLWANKTAKPTLEMVG
ncbi:hypothetical protein EJ05DRAFT_477072 [Pseudovirgaria hyperparasitica]|uniref:Galactose oxidase n=1 Tax=Pseudovirgaria hyperparasitica TaxID=470096 RepID=A0A6A6W1T3_9PEZI|nr:uncharacterized protein EJ05DRAFT_477072 [Pseudovirgaria hyperparasitica]KAF2756842.1 hypothetical protein EJ05DRAFT_477072 [Pseudovirgaria hyperparasitica]